MTRLVLLLVALAVLAPLPAVVLAPAVLAAAGAAGWWLWSCARWPAVWSPPALWTGAPIR